MYLDQKANNVVSILINKSRILKSECAALLCFFFLRFEWKGIVRRLITKNFLIKELNLFFFVIFGGGPNYL